MTFGSLSNMRWHRNRDDRPATAADLGDELRNAQRRNGLAVDDMSVPVEKGRDQRGEPNPALAQRPGAVEPSLRVIVVEDDVLLREIPDEKDGNEQRTQSSDDDPQIRGVQLSRCCTPFRPKNNQSMCPKHQQPCTTTPKGRMS